MIVFWKTRYNEIIKKCYYNAMMNKITINSESFECDGNNIIIENDKVIVNGKTIKDGLKGIVKVEFEGDLANLNCNTVTVHGNVRGGIDSNTVTINGNVEGDIDTNTIKCGDVNGDIDTTTITCKNHYGDIDM